MTYYFCSWGEGGDSDHTTIKHGQSEVGAWVRAQLGSVGIGCPEWIASEVDMLDAQASPGGSPIRIVYYPGDYLISITEITDLGDLCHVDADAMSEVRERFEDARRVVDAALASLDIC